MAHNGTRVAGEGFTDILEQRGLSSIPNWWRVGEDSFPAAWFEAEKIMRKYPRGLLDISSLAEVKKSIETGYATLWLGIDDRKVEAAMLTAICEYAHARHLYVNWAGGDGKKYLALGLKRLEEFCQHLHIDEFHVPGRKGIQRVMRKYGYECERVIMSKRFAPLTVRKN